MTEISLLYQEENDESGPIVASFRNGPPPRSALNPNSKSGLEFQMFCHENPKKKRRRIVVSQTEKVIYQGANFAHHNTSSNLSSYVVGIYDKNTHQVELHNVEHIFSLQQMIKGFESNPEENDPSKETNYMDRRRGLVEAFGNKTSKRIARTQQENRVQTISGASAITSILEKKLIKTENNGSNVYGSHQDSLALSHSRNQLLPPYNEAATTPKGVYDPRNFIDCQEMEALLLQADECIASLSEKSFNDCIKEYLLDGYTANCLIALPKPYNRQSVAYIFYIQYAIQFVTMRFPLKKSSRILAEELFIPPILVDHFLCKFAAKVEESNEKLKFTMSKAQKDKLLIHLLVVAITVGNSSIILEDLANSLKRTARTLQTYARQIGCIVSKTKASAMDVVGTGKVDYTRAVLTVPLKFPVLSRGRK